MYPVSRMPGAPACLAACVCLALFPLLAHADAPESIKTLDTLVVTSAAPSSPLNWVTDPRLPRQPVPASDGADYLKTVPGFSAIRNGGTNGDPVLRGMSGSRLNILSNDGSLIGACPSRMDNPLSYIAPETYDRLTVVKGPQSVRWGAGASAGTVRFERDMPRFDAPGMELQASALGGSNNRNDQMLDASFGSRPGYVRVNGNRSESGDYRDGNGEVVPSRWRKWNADAAIGWTPDADTVLELNAGTGDALARYAGRGMDGAAFKRSSYGLRFERGNAAHAEPERQHADADGVERGAAHPRRPHRFGMALAGRGRGRRHRCAGQPSPQAQRHARDVAAESVDPRRRARQRGRVRRTDLRRGHAAALGQRPARGQGAGQGPAPDQRDDGQAQSDRRADARGNAGQRLPAL